MGASSGLYDKFLIQKLLLNPQTLQFWFCGYTVLILTIILSILWFPYKEKRAKFTWRWSIIAVGILLQTADYFYFKALQDPAALIMLLSAIKRKMFKYEQIIIIYRVIRRLTGKFNTIYYAILVQIILFSDKNNLLIGVLKSKNGE